MNTHAESTSSIRIRAPLRDPHRGRCPPRWKPTVARAFVAATAGLFATLAHAQGAAERRDVGAPADAPRVLRAPTLAPSVTSNRTDAVSGASLAKSIADPRDTTTTQLTFRELGAREQLNFWRTGDPIGVPFSVRVDEVVTAARLRLNFSFPVQLARQAAQIKVMLNGEPVALIAITRDQAGANLTQEIGIDPRLIVDFNRLTMQIDSAVAECVEQGKGEPLARIGNSSSIELRALRTGLPNDLALLPLPFFDTRDPRPLNLPFVFGDKPSAAILEAAAVVASWFGAQASYRSARFPASFDALPDGDAVVFGIAGDRVAGIMLPAIGAPTLAVRAHPANATGRLLLVTGRDAQELKVAAIALAHGAGRVSGEIAAVAAPTGLRPRDPYETANWVPTKRAVKLGELTDVRNLSVSGQDLEPIRLNLRVPPDVFAWKSAGIPIDLKYRYLSKTGSELSMLNVNVNGKFVQAIPLRTDPPRTPWRSWFGMEEKRTTDRVLADGTVPGRRQILVHPSLIAAQSHMTLEYDFDYAGRATCGLPLGTTISGTIDPDSTIDLSGFRHYLPMPDLAAFSNAGFPYTRIADLSQTAVILPNAPGIADVTALLAVMGRMGESTGHPTTNVTVAPAAAVGNYRSKDLILIGSTATQPLLKEWASHMSWDVTTDRSHEGTLGWWERFASWLRTHDITNVTNGDTRKRDAPTRRLAGDSAIAGFESPLQAGRSVVALIAGQDGRMDAVIRALTDPERISRIHGSAVTVGADRVEMLSANTTYVSGNLSWTTRLQWYFSKHPLRLWATLIVTALLVALLLQRALQNRAAARLRME
ncbi:MAG: cellulose biosynthesis cyclic di-GMP-binding regulatory protein BcsB [Burkholderiales bacterium]